MVKNYGMEPKHSLPYNPKSNGIIERVHQTLANSLRTFEFEKRDLDEHDPWSPFLSAAAYAVRSTYHTTMQATPGQLVFGRDMVLPIKYKVDWVRLRMMRQQQMTRDNARENKTRIHHEYAPGDQCLLQKPGILPKLDAPRTGLHNVKKVYSNGTVEIERLPVTERVNIRRLKPFYSRSTTS